MTAEQGDEALSELIDLARVERETSLAFDVVPTPEGVQDHNDPGWDGYYEASEAWEKAHRAFDDAVERFAGDDSDAEVTLARVLVELVVPLTAKLAASETQRDMALVGGAELVAELEARALAAEAEVERLVALFEAPTWREIKAEWTAEHGASMTLVGAGEGVQHPAMKVLAAAAYSLLQEDGEVPPNYRVADLELKPADEAQTVVISVSACKSRAQTPHALRLVAEARVAELEEARAVGVERGHSLPGGSDPGEVA